MILILQIWKVRLREVKSVIQHHIQITMVTVLDSAPCDHILLKGHRYRVGSSRQDPVSSLTTCHSMLWSVAHFSFCFPQGDTCNTGPQLLAPNRLSSLPFVCVCVVYMYACICVGTCVCRYVCMYACKVTKLTINVFLDCSPLCFLKQGPLLNLELADSR